MFENILEELSNIFSALANEQRLKIVVRILKEEEVACEKLAEELPVTRPAISHHLKILRQTRIIKVQKRGQYMFYTLNKEYLLKISPEFVEFLEKEVEKWQE